MDPSPWLLVGLGNPGREYAHNRHNLGFMAVDQWVDRHGPVGVGDPWREKFHGRYASVTMGDQRVITLKPLTYMNRSGKSVVAAVQFFQGSPERIIVVHDELDFPFGRVAVKRGGGPGGHNGLRDIITLLGSRDFVRVRVGIGRPTRGGNVSKWVLTDFSGVEAAELPNVVERAEQAATTVITDGVAAAMNRFNQQPPPSTPTAIP